MVQLQSNYVKLIGILSHLGEYLDGYLELGANLKVSSKSGGLLLGILADESGHLQCLTTTNTNIVDQW